MKINYTAPVNSAVNTYKKQAAKATNMKMQSMAKDRIEISSSAKQFQLAFAAIKNQPETRTQLVEDLKAKVQSGEYRVPAEDIVDAMFK